jgi:hypothetical protein
MSELEKILDSIKSGEAENTAKQHWKPENYGSIDIRIASNGDWYHEGRRFQRDSLIKLFASVLRRENDDYFLVTPAEKLLIEVEDAPFVANLVETIDADGQQAIVFTINIGERIILDQEHDLRIEIDQKSEEPRPYIHFRNGLEALITRSAFYDLINLARVIERDGNSYLVVCSLGRNYELGSAEE